MSGSTKHNRKEVAELLLTNLSLDLDLLHHDLLLMSRGYGFRWAVDFSELHRYLHPTIDFLNDAARQANKFFPRQLAIRYLIDSYRDQRLILPSTLEEYTANVDHIYERVGTRPYVIADDPLEYHLRREKPLKKLYQVLDKLDLDEKLLAGLGSDIGLALGKGIKAKVYKAEYEAGVEGFRILLETGSLSVLAEAEHKAALSSADYHFTCKSMTKILDKERPGRYRSNRVDAENCAMLCHLNTTYADKKRLYVLVTDASMVRSKRFIWDPPISLDAGFEGQFPLLRSLNYCLLREYFHSGGGDLTTIIARVQLFRAFVQNGKNILRPTAGYRRYSESVVAQVMEIVEELADLHAWGRIKATLSERIQEALGYDRKNFSVLSGRDLPGYFSELVKDPRAVFEAYLGLEGSISKIRAGLALVEEEASDAAAIRAEKVSFFGVYPQDEYSDTDNDVGPALETVFRALALVGEDRAQAVQIEADVEKLRSIHPGSPALCVAHSICLRRCSQFDVAESALQDGEALGAGPGELSFHRAVLCRMRADAEPAWSEGQDEYLTRASEHVQSTLLSAKVRPKYRQLVSYLIWRNIYFNNPSALMALSAADKQNLEEAVRQCRTALGELSAEADVVADRMHATIQCDLAWNLALLGGKNNVAEALKRIRSISYNRLNRFGLDTLGWVLVQHFRLQSHPVDNMDSLRQAILAYQESLRRRGPSAVTMQGLGIAMNLFLEHGGTLADDNLK